VGGLCGGHDFDFVSQFADHGMCFLVLCYKEEAEDQNGLVVGIAASQGVLDGFK
jgi:hypothetical protein